jgi:hypothetical protein
MKRQMIDPEEYLERFCAELGVPATVRGEALRESTMVRKRDKRRSFLRLYQYKGASFIMRVYDRILGRYPDQSELGFAHLFELGLDRTWLMLALRFGDEGRLMRSCNVIGLSALRLLWNATHPHRRRIALPKLGE